MLSENDSRTSATTLGSHEPLASGLRSRAQGFGRFVRRADPWLALAVVGLSAWASWQAISWLLQSWQLY